MERERETFRSRPRRQAVDFWSAHHPPRRLRTYAHEACTFFNERETQIRRAMDKKDGSNMDINASAGLMDKKERLKYMGRKMVSIYSCKLYKWNARPTAAA